MWLPSPPFPAVQWRLGGRRSHTQRRRPFLQGVVIFEAAVGLDLDLDGEPWSRLTIAVAVVSGGTVGVAVLAEWRALLSCCVRLGWAGVCAWFVYVGHHPTTGMHFSSGSITTWPRCDNDELAVVQRLFDQMRLVVVARRVLW